MKRLLARLFGVLVLGVAVSPTVALAATAMTHAVEVYHDPACGCCVNWIGYMQTQGYVVTAHESSAMATVKMRLGVPASVASCHTAKIGGYVIEGHVTPGQDIRRLLAERPDAIWPGGTGHADGFAGHGDGCARTLRRPVDRAGWHCPRLCHARPGSVTAALRGQPCPATNLMRVTSAVAYIG